MDHFENQDIMIISSLRNIEERLKNRLDHCGVYYRLFSRAKSVSSINAKVNRKSYSPGGNKIQDIIGFRIVLYFISDVRPICEALCQDGIIDNISDSESEFKTNQEKCRKCDNYFNVNFDEIFRPARLNLVFKMDEQISNTFKTEIAVLPDEIIDVIDCTYEVQLRSVLSEGWHEVEHDLRYKCKEDWKGCEAESRVLNGIYGSLESQEYSMEMLFDKKAYKHYIEKKWDAMLRNHLRIRIADNLSDKLKSLLDKNPQYAKYLLRSNRAQIIKSLYAFSGSYIRNSDNMVFLINRLIDQPINDIKILEPDIISMKLDKMHI